MKRSDVLLLSGAGFVGTALANKLATEGRQVYVLAPSTLSAPLNIYFLQGRLGDLILLAGLLPHCGTVIHLASATKPGNSANHSPLELGNLVLSLRSSKAYGPVQAERGFGLIPTLLEHARRGSLGSGREYSINQVRRVVEQVTSWKPQTSLKVGVRRTWDWLKQA